MRVSINKPCHENWDAMTPKEQGAFCLACQKTVVDFSQKTTDEIKDFFRVVPPSEKICGRFRNDQLNELSFDEFFVKFKNWIMPKKLAVILCFSFGLTLFSCKTTQEPLMGDVSIDTELPPKELINGKVVYTADTAIKSVTTNTVVERPEVKMGEVVASPSEIELDNPGKCAPADSSRGEEFIKGKIKIDN